MYHRVIDPDKLCDFYIQPGMYTTKAVFDKHMKYLSRNYNVITIADLIDLLQNGTRLRGNICLITFDDGWYDTYIYAFPILKKYNLPATVFLVSNYVGTNAWFWPEKVSLLLTKYFEMQSTEEDKLRAYPALQQLGLLALASKPGSTPAQKIEAAISAIKQLDEATILKIIGELEDLLKVSTDLLSSKRILLNWNEAIEMSRSCISFGSHTKNHSILTMLSAFEMSDEILASKREIETRLANPCKAFCYPNGNYNSSVKLMVMEHYDCAFTTQSGFVKTGDDRYTLKRLAIHDGVTHSKALFACTLTGIFS